jgi:hypothetical protein
MVYCERGRGFNSRIVQTYYYVWMNMSVCIGFSMYSMCVLTKKKYKSMYIYPLSGIHNTSLISAYFGLDKRECECLEYLFI